LLRAAGLVFDSVAPRVDETALKRAARGLGESAENAALRLARSKAEAVDRPGLVIGCDQILVCDGVWFDKPGDLATARANLLALRGRAHRLATAVAVLRDGAELFRHVASPTLTMRDFSERFLSSYLAADGEHVLGCVGAYRVEGLGLHLFESIDGEHGAILGLPLLPLLGFLRGCGIIAA
jgi:septum formation protein